MSYYRPDVVAPEWVKQKVPPNILKVLKPIQVIERNRNSGYAFVFFAVRSNVDIHVFKSALAVRNYKKNYYHQAEHMPVLITLSLKPGTIICVNNMHHKIRANKADVVDIVNQAGNSVRNKVVSSHDRYFVYTKGQHITPSNGFSMMPRNECEPGIHFYFSKKQVVY